jgi:hypothetical protein
MKAKDLLIGGAVVGGLAWIFFQKKDSISGVEAKRAKAPDLLPVEDAPVMDSESGEGAELVRNRMFQLYNSQEGEQIKQSSRTNVYQGLAYPTGMRQLITEIYGGASLFPSVPSEIDGGFLNWLDDIEKGPNFEEITSNVGIDQAKETWSQILNYNEYTLWPIDVESLINQNAFGKASKKDKNKSERYNAMIEDLKKFASNLYKFTKSYSQNLKNEAILDLQTAGYKFL